jgi:hypothetical protein
VLSLASLGFCSRKRQTTRQSANPYPQTNKKSDDRLISELALLKTAAAADDAAAAGTATTTTTTAPTSTPTPPSSLSRREASDLLEDLLSALADCVSALDGSGRGRHDALLGQALTLPVWSVDEVGKMSFPLCPFRRPRLFFFPSSPSLFHSSPFERGRK